MSQITFEKLYYVHMCLAFSVEPMFLWTADSSESAKSQDGEEVAEMASWLKENHEPDSKVKDFMAKTAHYCKQLIHEEHTSLGNILQEFPRILDNGFYCSD